jgi:hypothetical protein
MISSGTQIVGTTRVPINGIAASPCKIKIRNNDSNKTLYIGGPDVTSENGLGLDKLVTIDFDLPAGEQLFMITTDGDHSVSWLRIVQ